MTTHISTSGLKRQAIFWLGALACLIIFLMVFRSILLPFVAGMAVAYFLDPVADWFEARGLSRMAATVTILFIFILIVILFLAILIPLLGGQIAGFIDKLPGYVSGIEALIAKFRPDMLPTWMQSHLTDIKSSLSNLLGEGASFVSSLFGQIWSSGLALLDILSLMIVTPVVAFYLLLDWDRMVARLDTLVPRDYLDVVRRLSGEINETIAGFVRGQGTLCIVLGVYYATGLTLTGLNFGLLIGLFAGLISFIPYAGSTLGFVLAVGVALFQFWPDYLWIALVALVFFSGQFLEGNVLQPKLVGEKVGLHPVWLMFALFAFGLLFGFVGLLVAVPVSAAIGVLVRFTITVYLDSDLYQGHQRAPKGKGKVALADVADKDSGDAG